MKMRNCGMIFLINPPCRCSWRICCRVLLESTYRSQERPDVFFLLEKVGKGYNDFLEIRKKILERYHESGEYRIVVAKIPRGKKAASHSFSYPG